MGLAISRKFSELMGGDLVVESELGRGARFTVTLPVEAVEAVETVKEGAEAGTGAVVSVGSGNDGKIVLVIDDDENVRDLMRRSLGREGYRVETASGGAAGLESAERLRPAVITLDVMMPGMDGWAVLSALKNHRELADIPVIMVTILDDKQLAFSLGATDYITKPIDWERLSALMRKHTRPSEAGRRVLVVDDDASARDLLRRALEKSGWDVTEATNGKEGLEAVARSSPEVVLLDLMMPVMDGFQFLHELRNSPAGERLPVIVVTSKDLTEEERMILNGQVSQILQKGGYRLDELMTQIRRLSAGFSGG